jgi:hypothetical protein
MEWKAGDTAKAIYDIVKISYNETGKPSHRALIIKSGDHFTVNDITDGPCQLMLDIGVAIHSPNLYCICDQCKPTHDVPAKIEKGAQTFLLSSWFVNTKDTIAMVRVMEKRQENPQEKRKKILISNPNIRPNFLPAKYSKQTEKIPTFQ